MANSEEMISRLKNMTLYYLCEVVGVSGSAKYIVTHMNNVNHGKPVLMGNHFYYYNDQRSKPMVVQVVEIGLSQTHLEKQAEDLFEAESQTQDSPKSPSLLSGTRYHENRNDLNLIDDDENTNFSEGLHPPQDSQIPVSTPASRPEQQSQRMKSSTRPSSSSKFSSQTTQSRKLKPNDVKTTRIQRMSKNVLNEWNNGNSENMTQDSDDAGGDDDFPMHKSPPPKKRKNGTKTNEASGSSGQKSKSTVEADLKDKMKKQADEIAALKKEKDELQSQVWSLENENSELASKISRNDETDSEKITKMLEIMSLAFPAEASESSGSDTVKLGSIFDMDEKNERKRVSVNVDREDYIQINFNKPLDATKELSLLVFGHETLATHTLSGNKCNAHRNVPVKPALNKQKVKLVLSHVMNKFEKLKKDEKPIFDKRLKEKRALVWPDLEQALREKCSAASKSQ